MAVGAFSVYGAANAGHALYKSLPAVMPFDEQTAGIHILAPRKLREASFHAGHVIFRHAVGMASHVYQHVDYALL